MLYVRWWNVLVLGAAAGLTGIAAFEWMVAAAYEPLNPDAGYYAGIGRLVADGYTPYKDIPSHYAPGVYYILSLAGADALGDPLRLRLLVYAFHFVSAALVLLIARRLGHSLPLACLWAAVFLTWIIRLGGTAVVLEPFVNVFALAAFLATLYLRGALAALAVGLLVGIALLSKQYALLLVPALVLALLRAPRLDGRAPAGFSAGSVLRSLALFGVAVAIPYFLFALTTGQELPGNLIHIATFGRAALWSGSIGAGSYEARGLGEVIWVFRAASGAFQLVIPVALASVLLVLVRPTATSLVLALAFLSPLAQLLIRTYPHYLQLCVPWGVLVLAQLTAAVLDAPDHRAYDADSGDAAMSSRAPALVALLAALLFVPSAYISLLNARYQQSQTSFEEQVELARQVRAVLPARDDVLVINGTWLYLLADLVPPARNFGFVQSPNDYMLGASAHVVLLPFRRFPFDEARAWIESSGFSVTESIGWRGETVLIYSR